MTIEHQDDDRRRPGEGEADHHGVTTEPRCPYGNMPREAGAGHWREWHRGHGCRMDPEVPRPRIIEPKLMSAESLAEDRRYLERYGLDPCDIEYRLLAHIAALENQLDGLGYWQVNCEDARAMRDVAISERDVALIRVNELEDALGEACGDMPDGEQHDRLYGVLARKQR